MNQELHCPKLKTSLLWRFPRGTVWLVGAGPGDPGLLTLHGVDAIRQADAILYDALVSEEILEYARPSVLFEFVGKRGGKPSPSQASINQRLIELARARKRVVRLKGGDPFVFGRGSEEAMALACAGIQYRVVPGVTAGIGGLTYAGIPLTSRGTNHGVILATGYSAPDAKTTLDWQALARTGLPVVLYMAMSNLATIAAAMIEGGRPIDTPVAIVSDATTDRQRVLVTSLDRAQKDAETQGFVAPAIIAIGEIVAFRESIANLRALVDHE